MRVDQGDAANFRIEVARQAVGEHSQLLTLRLALAWRRAGAKRKKGDSDAILTISIVKTNPPEKFSGPLQTAKKMIFASECRNH
jgi:hypothetical protein